MAKTPSSHALQVIDRHDVPRQLICPPRRDGTKVNTPAEIDEDIGHAPPTDSIFLPLTDFHSMTTAPKMVRLAMATETYHVCVMALL